ncbi:MAG: hypothetical protein ACJ8DI_30560 [Ktedonobacteraceae bacterium]
MRIAFFQKEEESFWQPLNGNPHFRQRILAKACFKALPTKLKKWQLITATLEFNAGKAQQGTQASRTNKKVLPSQSMMAGCLQPPPLFVETRLPDRNL